MCKIIRIITIVFNLEDRMIKKLLYCTLMFGSMAQASIYQLTMDYWCGLDGLEACQEQEAIQSYIAKLDGFLQYGSNIDLKGEDGRTALMLAMIYGNDQMVEALLSRDASGPVLP